MKGGTIKVIEQENKYKYKPVKTKRFISFNVLYCVIPTIIYPEQIYNLRIITTLKEAKKYLKEQKKKYPSVKFKINEYYPDKDGFITVSL